MRDLGIHGMGNVLFIFICICLYLVACIYNGLMGEVEFFGRKE
jgi:hypothetical protein